MGTLSRAQIDQFVELGYVRLDGAFDRALVAPCVERLEVALRDEGVDPDDPATWTRPVVRLLHFDDPPFYEATNTERLYGAWDQLVGRDRWYPRPGLGTFPVRFPSEVDPGDAGWHFDGSYAVDGQFHANVRSRGRALLMLFLLSDIGDDDAPTRIRVGSHLDVPSALLPFGEEGVLGDVVVKEISAELEARPVEHATGQAGDVYLCHPFLVHAAGWPHRGSGPRYLAQPPLALREPLNLEAFDPTPVERAVQIGLAQT